MDTRSWVKFPYYRDREDVDIPRPNITVEVRLPGMGEIDTIDALVDSGATHSLFHVRVAKNIGYKLLHWGKKIPISVGGRNYLGSPAKIELRVAGFIYFVPMDVVFIDDFELTALLGQEQFFLFHKVCFDRAGMATHIARNPMMSFPDLSGQGMGD